MAPAVEVEQPPASDPDLPSPAGPNSVSSSKDADLSSASEGESDRNEDGEARVRAQSKAKPEDLESDLYYNHEEDEAGMGSISSAGKGEVYNSLLSEFDDFVANEKNEAFSGSSRALSYGFEVGDMVWGKVKSHPWWPGHLFDEGLATSSVRRTRREGHILVVFFGDSSYGWFDPAELVPFEDHFEEKARQTSSRTFVRAVEEAVDEASRRVGLGLVCKCRNPYNFRPTGVSGYFKVDVPDFESNGVYSKYQIRRAREEFRPAVMLDFVKRVAVDPGGCDVGTMDSVKYKATAFGFRKAVFEEFDETYAQAFGLQSSKPSKCAANLSEHPIRSPLSGPLVIAEALGGGKIFKRTMKAEDQLKKDKYVLKEKDVPSDENVLHAGQKQSSAAAQMDYVGDSSTLAGDFVQQKRTLAMDPPPTADHSGLGSKEVLGTFINEVTKVEAVVEQVAIPDANLPEDVEKVPFQMQELKLKTEPGSAVVADPQSTYSSDSSSHQMTVSPHQQHDTVVHHGTEERGKASMMGESFQRAKLDATAKVEADSGLSRLQDSHPVPHAASIKAKRQMTSEGGIVRKKLFKPPLGDNGSESSTTLGEKKKKKRKKEFDVETSSDRPKKLLAVGKGGSLGNFPGDSIHQTGFSSKDGSHIVCQMKDASSGNLPSNVGASLPLAGLGTVELDVPQLVRNLHALALGPFDGVPGSTSSISLQFLFRFRSLVYQKSLVLSPPPEMEQVDAHAKNSSGEMGGSKKLAKLKVRESTHPKPEKGIAKTQDPAKISRKCMLSDRQEEISAQRLKKLKHLKSLVEEKKTGQKALEPHRTDAKNVGSVAPQRPVKPDVVRKMESPARSIEPTMLVMKFPPQTSLPSAAELKAKFARFGSIDLQAIRVFWKSSTCRVVFRHKHHALAAYKYAIANSSLFGNVEVRYTLRGVSALPGPEAPESGNERGDDASYDAPCVKDSLTVPGIGNQLLQQSGLLKSILKKPSGDEAAVQGTGGNGGRGARVKFLLGGEESTTSRGEQLTVGNRNHNFNNSASFADDAGVTPTSVAMDFNSKNVQKVPPPSQLSPLLPVPPQYGKAQHNNPRHYTEVPPRNVHNANAAPAPIIHSVDISHQMLSLLTRCSGVVSDITGVLGYVPYHPL